MLTALSHLCVRLSAPSKKQKMQQALIEVVSNVRARLSGVAKKVISYLDANLSEVQKGSEWSPFHRRFGGKWDGKKHHFAKSRSRAGEGTFPKGLLHRVQKLLLKQGIKAKLRDLRSKDEREIDWSIVEPDMLHGVSMSGMYDYQLDAVKIALRKEAGVLFMATNAGKTEISTAIIRALGRRTVLFVVPTKNLLRETRKLIAERLGTIPETIGTIGGGFFDPKEITIAVINSVTPAHRALSARGRQRNAILSKYLKTVDAVFLDEGHHAKANTWWRLMTALSNARYRYLMSGTPFTGDNDLMIEAAAGPVLFEIRNDELIDRGVSAKPTIKLHTVAKPDLEGEDALDDESFDSVYKAGIVLNEYRNKLIARIAATRANEGKSVIILVRILAQGSELRSKLVERGVPVEFAHGQMPDTEQDRIKDWFSEKSGRVMIGSTIFDEGVNMPQINVLIVADGQKSLRKVLQQIGRSIRRKKQGENVVEVNDFADCTHHWLADHSLERFDIYESEGFEIVEDEPIKEMNGRKEEVSSTTLSALSAQTGSRGDARTIGVVQLSTAGFTTTECEGSVSESSDFMLWRWRSAT
jgi:superfamily II DNA or RNA helicase